MTAPADRSPDDVFFNSRPVLAHLRDYARARLVSPWAVLGITLARAVAATPPTVQLPGIIGGPQSLNLFIAAVGASGVGKGAAEAAATRAITFTDRSGTPIAPPVYPVGSGEGIARTFRPHGTEDDAPNPVTAALFTAGEVDTLGALGARKGSTLMPQLRHLYSGEEIGFNNAGKDTRVIVPRHSYRAALVVGVQPLKASILLDDADGGTPQRFVWVSAYDPDAPDHAPACPDPITVTAPSWGPAVTELIVPERVVDEVTRFRRSVIRKEDVDPLDGHALLCRLKVAAALMLLDGRSIITDEDWQLSGPIMSRSSSTRAMCIEEARRKSAATNRARGRAAAEKDEAIEERRHTQAKGYVMRALEREGGQAALGAIQSRTKQSVRPYLEAAIHELLDSGQIESSDTENGAVYRTAGGTAGTAVQRTKPQVDDVSAQPLYPLDNTKPQVKGAVPTVPPVPERNGVQRPAHIDPGTLAAHTRADFITDARAALDPLRGKHRTAAEAHYFRQARDHHDMTQREIAEAFGVSNGTVGNRINGRADRREEVA